MFGSKPTAARELIVALGPNDGGRATFKKQAPYLWPAGKRKRCLPYHDVAFVKLIYVDNVRETERRHPPLLL